MSAHQYFKNVLVVIKGAGDLASGVAYRLKRSGFPLIMTELPTPLFVRRTVSFGEAVYSHETAVEGMVARRVETPQAAFELAASDIIPILVDPEATIIGHLQPPVVVDAIMAKVNTGTTRNDAPLVIALGPGFAAGHDCHVVVETSRGHRLGRVINKGTAEHDTGTPGIVKGHTMDRVLRAPAEGQIIGQVEIGAQVTKGQLIATLNSTLKPHEIRAAFDGVLRGLIHPEVKVTTGLKIGDLDPRGKVDHCFTISDKSLAIGGGVLEAILASEVFRAEISGSFEFEG